MSINYTRSAPSASPVTRTSLLLGLSFGLHFLALLFVAARITVKWKLKQLGKEDVFIIMAAGMTLAFLLTTSAMTKVGFGMHTADFRPEWIPNYRKFFFATSILGSIPSALTKLSMLCFYLRLSPHPTFRCICYICVAYVTLAYTAISLINMFGCSPISGGWSTDPNLHAKCITKIGFYYYTAINNSLMDLLLLMLPIPILIPLRVRVRVKLGLVAMFTMGFFVTGVSMYFLYTMYRAINSKDSAWDVSYSWLIGNVECNVAIMTASMPGVMAFIRWMRGDDLEREVLGRPGAPGSHVPTIGGGHRPRVYRDGMSPGNSEEFVLHSIPRVVVSTEVLLQVEHVGV